MLILVRQDIVQLCHDSLQVTSERDTDTDTFRPAAHAG